MKKSTKTGLTSLVITMSMIPLVALAIPGIPHQFYGDVTFESGATPNGLLVEAKVDSIVVGTSQTKDGRYGINPYLLKASKSDGEWSGETVHFFVAGIDTKQSHSLEKGGYTSLNLAVPGSVGTIEETNEDAVIENKTVVVTPSQPTNIKLGTSLSINVTSATNTIATVEKIEKLSSGNVAVFSGKNFLNAYEIKITGESLNIAVTISYDETGIDEDTVAPYWFNGIAWKEIADSTVNKNDNTVTFTISSGNTIYAVFGSEPEPESEPTPTPTGGGGGIADTTAPSISAVNAVAGDTTATITWQTNEASISWLIYGKTTAYDEETKTTTYLTSHSVTLNDLSPATTYHYQLKSKDVSGNVGSYTDKTFTTLALGEKIIADINNDNKVDIFDFNLLMVNWGSTSANNAADFNDDGKVDVFDFNLLMINWTL